jgi:hypothetical protein
MSMGMGDLWTMDQVMLSRISFLESLLAALALLRGSAQHWEARDVPGNLCHG